MLCSFCRNVLILINVYGYVILYKKNEDDQILENDIKKIESSSCIYKIFLCFKHWI